MLQHKIATTAFLISLILAAHTGINSCLAQGGIKRSSPGKQSKGKEEIKVQLPLDADTPVLTMDTYGGFRMKAADGFAPTPLLQIYADGRIVTGRKSDNVVEVKGAIDLVELQALLSYIVDDCHFFEISSESIKADLAKKGVLKIMDAGTTKIAVKLKDHSQEVEVYGLQAYASQHTDVASFASMVAVASRCRQLISEIKLGSEEEAGAALTAANKKLTEKNKTSPPFTMKHLQFAEQFKSGRRSATFVQNYSEGNKSFMAFATYEVDAKGNEATTAEVHERAQARRK